MWITIAAGGSSVVLEDRELEGRVGKDKEEAREDEEKEWGAAIAEATEFAEPASAGALGDEDSVVPLPLGPAPPSKALFPFRYLRASSLVAKLLCSASRNLCT